MASDDTVFDNLPSDPVGQGGAGGWSPSAWNRINALQKTQPDIANTIAGLSPAEANDYFFDAPNAYQHPDNMLTDVLWHHDQDKQAAAALQDANWRHDTWGSQNDQEITRWRGELDRLRSMSKAAPPQGRPFQTELNALSDAWIKSGGAQKWAQPNPTASRLVGGNITYPTWSLPKPNVAPFPANDPRGSMGTTLNTARPMIPPQATGRAPSGLMSAEEAAQRMRESLQPPPD